MIRFLRGGEIYTRMRRLQGIMPFVKQSLDEIISNREQARINEVRRKHIDRWSRELDEYAHLQMLYDKLKVAKSNSCVCACCGFKDLHKLAISYDGSIIVGMDCLEHYSETFHCDRFREITVEQVI
jgi:hypothetical protein